MAQPTLDMTRITAIAEDMLRAHGSMAYQKVTDMIAYYMGGDPAMEDVWHAVFDALHYLDPSS